MEVLEEQAEEGGQLHTDHGEDRVRVQFGRPGWTLDKNFTQMLLQCGMEFDRGFSFCRSFQLPDPCEHLWCAHQVTMLLKISFNIFM